MHRLPDSTRYEEVLFSAAPVGIEFYRNKTGYTKVNNDEINNTRQADGTLTTVHAKIKVTIKIPGA